MFLTRLYSLDSGGNCLRIRYDQIERDKSQEELIRLLKIPVHYRLYLPGFTDIQGRLGY